MENNMNSSIKNFFINLASGFLIGIAFVVPGFSGSTIAVVIGIYDKMIASVTGIFKSFKKSFFYLLPIAIGMILAFAALYFPIKLALQYIPFPILCLFVGLMLGGMPPVMEKAKGIPEKKINLAGNIFTGVLALSLTVGISFMPSDLLSPSLGNDMTFAGYALLFAVGVLAAGALVVPGISGSMILMIFGYYSPIMHDVIGSIIKFTNFWHNALVIAVLGVGMIVGFFAISFLMKYLLKKFPRGTYYAIIGFVLGSVIAIFYGGAAGKFSVSDGVPLVFDFTPWQIALAVMLFVVGFAGAFVFYFATKNKAKEKEAAETAENVSE